MKMTKKYLLILTALMLPIQTYAGPVSVEEAQHKAAEFMIGQQSFFVKATRRGAASVSDVVTTLETAESRPAYHVFNVSETGGYIIVSGDDRMPVVLGYSEYGTYRQDSLPENMRAWMEQYAEQYDYLQSHSSEVTSYAATRRTQRAKIYPLLDTSWNQYKPYNDLCPVVEGKKCVTGCVPTAIAQIMKYHEWPKQTTKTIPGYITETKRIEMPAIEVTTIDWDNFTDTEIAKLMLLCGCACQTNYHYTGSPTYSNSIVNALEYYFDYKNTITRKKQKDYTYDAWNDLIYNELANKRPVYYDGSLEVSCAGHAFVIDGYDDNDYFHVNWGWGGQNDGFFLLFNFNSEPTGQVTEQAAYIGIEGKNEHLEHKYTYATISDEGTLTMYYDDNREKRSSKIYGLKNLSAESWKDYESSAVQKVVIDASLNNNHRLKGPLSLFKNHSNLKSIEGLSYLHTENITDMSYMFSGCKSLESIEGLSSLNTGNVTDMSNMFSGCKLLESIEAISSFNTGNVTSMYRMFSGCESLTSTDLSSLDVSKVETMVYMFEKCKKLKSVKLSHYNAPQLLYVLDIFSDCESLSTVDMSYFNAPKLTRMEGLFEKLPALTTLNISHWDMAEVPSMYGMVSECPLLETVNFSFLNAPKLTDTRYLFYLCSSLKTLNMSQCNAPQIKNMERMFANCISLESVDKSVFNFSNVEKIDYLFHNCQSLKSIDWSNLEAPYLTSFNHLFYDCKSLETINMSHFSGPQLVGNYRSFEGCESLKTVDMSYFNAPKLKDLEFIFKTCTSLETLNMAHFKAGALESTRAMVANCTSLTTLDLSNFDSSNVKDMVSMFSGCNSLTSLNLDNLNTSQVTSMSGMFSGCSSLTSLNLNNFNTSQVTSMSYMFSGCSSLTSLNLDNFNTSQVTSMSYMFSGCSSLTSLNLDNFDTSKVTEMNSMFNECQMLEKLDLCSFNTSQVKNTERMFYNCSKLKTIWVSDKWDMSNVIFTAYMFAGAYNIVGGCGTVWSQYAFNGSRARIDQGDKRPGYFTEQGKPAYGEEELKCVTPSISVVDGWIVFSCDTEGATCHYTVSCDDCKSGEGTRMSLTTTYNVSVYASKEGKQNSEAATKTIKLSIGEKGDVNGDGKISISDAVSVINIIKKRGAQDTAPTRFTEQRKSATSEEGFKCASPTISVVDNELIFFCDTEGATCHYTVSCDDCKSGEGTRASLTTTYNVSVYASKEGKQNSETTTKTIKLSIGEKGDVNDDGIISISDAINIVDTILKQGGTKE